MPDLEPSLYSLAPMTLDDIPTVAAIEDFTFALPWSATAFRYEILNNQASEYYVARYRPWHTEPPKPELLRRVRRAFERPPLDASLVGYGGLWIIIDEAHICTLAVTKPWRGRGLGELLLAKMIERAALRGAEMVTLEVRLSNRVAQSLYKKYGFEIVGRRKCYYSDNGEDAHIMTTPRITTSAYQARLRGLLAQLQETFLAAEKLPPPLPEKELP
jgi:ribosomal-protein-alanine N-acetyltransferase